MHLVESSKKAFVLAYGGLGNQLFQYSFAHYIQKIFSSIRLENTGLMYRNGEYLLKDLADYTYGIGFKTHRSISYNNLWGRLLLNSKIAPWYSEKLYKYRQNTVIFYEKREDIFDSDILKFPYPPSAMFKGVWMHWKYIYPNKETIFSNLCKFLNYGVINETLEKNNMLIVHVRRGDFTNMKVRNRFGLIPLISVERKIKEILETNNKLKVITITDDKNRLGAERPSKFFGKILNPKDCSTWQTLGLMSHAKHVIASNSTLSWWGAVLALNNGATCYIPSQYYKLDIQKDCFDFPGLFKYQNELI